MGVSHGLYCLRCCWARRLLLFVGGVMNLTVILTLTAWVALDKLATSCQTRHAHCAALQ